MVGLLHLKLSLMGSKSTSLHNQCLLIYFFIERKIEDSDFLNNDSKIIIIIIINKTNEYYLLHIELEIACYGEYKIVYQRQV